MLAALVVGGALALFPGVSWAFADADAGAPGADAGVPSTAMPAPAATPPPGASPAPASPPAAAPTPAAPPSPAAASPPAPPPAAAPAKPAAPKAEPNLTSDELPNAGYVPGYRTYKGLSQGPYAPVVGALPGGMTPGFAAPMPPGQWTFRYTGFMSASLISSVGTRRDPTPDQSKLVFHIPAQTVDEYASFMSTNTMPGQWVAMNFSYGNGVVSANISLNTWNPSDPTTYYQIGSQYFVNNAFLQLEAPTLGIFKMKALAGYYYNNYGALGQYGLGMYTSPIIAQPNGVGVVAHMDVRVHPTLDLFLEHGLMGNRKSKAPEGLIANGGNAMTNPIFGSSYIHHIHAGFVWKGEPVIKGSLHWMTNFSRDDRAQRVVDNPVTRGIDESHVKDGHIDVYGAEAGVQSGTWGYFGAAASYTSAADAYNVKGLATFGGDGQALADRWFGQSTTGTGKLYAVALNYSGSLGRILTRPQPYPGDAPDLVINAGFTLAYGKTNAHTLLGTTDGGPSASDADIFNDRLRYKGGVEGIYTFFSWMGAGMRVDRVAPTSKDAGETYHVLASRLIFKTNWGSRDNIQIVYAKWFYGPRTHADGSSTVPSDIGLDDQLIAVNVNMWW